MPGRYVRHWAPRCRALRRSGSRRPWATATAAQAQALVRGEAVRGRRQGWPALAPPAWSGPCARKKASADQMCHRLSDTGTGINRTLHIMPAVQLRIPTRSPAQLRPEEGIRDDLDKQRGAA